ncbi:MAG: UDP-3-O-(3-hydroxymyristoyl)glucosamine N-acyltransferase [Chloroflexi bacterium]|nr:UDP-3-O-(3-hydroxymyristoyl)glucosamine N-acyltransferase [Chloroflexota bacterium]
MPMMSVRQLAELVGGRLAGMPPDPEAMLTGTCPVDSYRPHKVAYARDKRYADAVGALAGAFILLPDSIKDLADKFPANTYIIVDDVYNRMMDLQDYFYGGQGGQPGTEPTDVAPTARVDASARIGQGVSIGHYCVVGRNVSIGDRACLLAQISVMENVSIGRNTIVYPGVAIYPGTQIGDGCIIHSGARLGVDGFRFHLEQRISKVRKWLAVGTVILGDRVEFGANSTIDRATFEGEATILGNDVKVDDQVHIGHNARIGDRTLLAAQTCVSGRVRIGEDVWIGAGVTISQGIVVGNKARLLLNAVVASDVAEGESVSGFYAMPHNKWLRAYIRMRGNK